MDAVFSRLLTVLATAIMSYLLAGCAQQLATTQPSATDDQTVQTLTSEVRIAEGSFSIADAPPWVKSVELPEKGASAPIYIRLHDVQHRFDDQGINSSYFHFVFAGNDKSQTQRLGQQSLTFDPHYQKLVLNTASIIRDGQRINVRSQIKPKFLSDDRAKNTVFLGHVNVSLQIPDFRPDDQLEIAWTVSGANPLFSKNPWSSEEWLRIWPIWHRRLSYSWPESIPFRLSIYPHSDTTRSRTSHIKRDESISNGWHQLVFTDSNIPSAVIETRPASEATQNDLFLLTSFRDWNAVAAWANELFENTAKPQGSDYTKLLEEVSKQPTQAEQVTAVLQWVQREIRYVSIGLGENSHRPSAPDEVLARRYGDCKDTALLVVSLLRALGIESYPALLNTFSSRLFPRLDAIPGFNHAVAVVWLDGQVYVLDGTVRGQISKLQHLGASQGGEDIFVISGPHTGFLRAPFNGSIEDRTFRHDTHMVINANDESGTLKTTSTLRGIAAEKKRNDLAATQKVDMRRRYLNDVRRHYPNAEWISGPDIMDDQAINALTVRTTFKIPRPLKRSGAHWRHEYRNDDLMARLSRADTTKRKVPIKLPQAIQRVILSHTMDIPPGMKIDESPFVERISSPAFSATLQRQQPSSSRVIDRQELTLLKETVETAEIPAYQEAVQLLSEFRSEIRIKKQGQLERKTQAQGQKSPPATTPAVQNPTRTSDR